MVSVFAMLADFKPLNVQRVFSKRHIQSSQKSASAAPIHAGTVAEKSASVAPIQGGICAQTSVVTQAD